MDTIVITEFMDSNAVESLKKGLCHNKWLIFDEK